MLNKDGKTVVIRLAIVGLNRDTIVQVGAVALNLVVHYDDVLEAAATRQNLQVLYEHLVLFNEEALLPCEDMVEEGLPIKGLDDDVRVLGSRGCKQDELELVGQLYQCIQ